MELTNTFRVPGPVDRAWAVLTDLERAAACLPGAALVEVGVDGAAQRGTVEVRVGPVTARYEGVARFVRRDEQAHHAVLLAEGHDLRGQGEATATVDLRLAAMGDGTEIVVATDLTLTGAVARFGPGVIAEVGGKLAGRFAQRLEEELDREPVSTARRPADTTPAMNAKALAPTDPIPIKPAPIEPASIEPASTASPTRSDRLGRRALPVGTAAVGLLLGWLVGRAGRCGLGDGRQPADRIDSSEGGAA